MYQHQSITIENKTYFPEDFLTKKIPDFVSISDFHASLYTFLTEWFSRNPLLKVKTSGSTSIPKEMDVEKNRMLASARLTCDFLKLKKGNTALLCMPLDYIAGKMMVVRALVAGLNLYLQSPSGRPLKNTDTPFDFAAVTPLQVYNSLQHAEDKKRLSAVKKLIIGGGSIDTFIAEELKKLPNPVYSTYGMTETLSHIALRKLNGQNASDYYTPFPSVSLSLSEDNALIINAPIVADTVLYTNDIAEMNADNSFRIIGRKDNIINCGGIKIQIEELEAQLKPYISGKYAITSLPDPKFGEIAVLVSEQKIDTSLLAAQLATYHLPKKIIKMAHIPLTETGKINRFELKKMITDPYLPS